MKIIHKFKIRKDNKLTLYAKTSDQEYTKSYLVNNNFTFDFISKEEYITALATLLLYNKELN